MEPQRLPAARVYDRLVPERLPFDVGLIGLAEPSDRQDKFPPISATAAATSTTCMRSSARRSTRYAVARKSWASREMAKKVHANFLCLAHNLMLLLEGEVEQEAGESRATYIAVALQRMTLRCVKCPGKMR